jgi:hypothetical protein
MTPDRGSERVRRALLIAACTMTLTIVAAGPAAAGGLLVSPTGIDVNVRPGTRLPPITVRNDSGRDVVIDVAAVPARQELSGLPTFDLSAPSVLQGRAMLHASPQRLRLAAGKSARVRVIAGRPPTRGQVGVYAVVAFTARQIAKSKAGAVVAPTIRLTSNLLLRYPGKARLDGRATALRVEQGAKRTLRFFARIRNDGNLHLKPLARLTVTSAAGRRVVRRAVHPENVLPGFERELLLDITKPLAAGDYRARIDARVGSRRSSRKIDFTLVGPNELPTPKLEIVSLQNPRPDADENFDVALVLRNTGTGPITPQGTLTLTHSGRDDALVAKPLRPSELGAGSKQKLVIELPGVAPGRYTLTARFADGPLMLAERTVVFDTGTRPSLLDRILDWLAGNIPLLLIGFAALLLVVVSGMLAYIRRLRRRVVPVS